MINYGFDGEQVRAIKYALKLVENHIKAEDQYVEAHKDVVTKENASWTMQKLFKERTIKLEEIKKHRASLRQLIE